MEVDYEWFKREILKLTHIDLNCYKEKQMKRRIESLIANHKISGYANYVSSLKSDTVLFDEFMSYITINVSEFFRNPEQWQYMEKEVIPYLLSKFGRRIKVWSAACSTGDEPYSLAMILSKFIPLSQITVYATDLDKQILAKAKVGVYSEKSLHGVPEDLKKRYFTKIGQSYQIHDEIKQCVRFQQHNLLKDVYPTDCQMIVCRNVLIYFTEEAKDETFRKFYKCLPQNGVLFIGSTEQITDYKGIGYQRMNSFFYQK